MFRIDNTVLKVHFKKEKMVKNTKKRRQKKLKNPPCTEPIFKSYKFLRINDDSDSCPGKDLKIFKKNDSKMNKIHTYQLLKIVIKPGKSAQNRHKKTRTYRFGFWE